MFQCHSNETVDSERQKIANRMSKTPDHIQVVVMTIVYMFQCHSNETLDNVRQKIANRMSKTPDHIQVVAQDKHVVSHPIVQGLVVRN